MTARWFQVEPPEIQLDGFCFDTHFHQSSQALVAGLITGEVEVFTLTQDESLLKTRLQPHTDACRRLRFVNNTEIVSVGSDRAIALSDISRSSVTLRIDSAHDSPINSVLPILGLVLTGDDDGVVKAWDFRDPEKFKYHFTRHREQISNMLLVGEFSLYTSSIEGVVTEFDLRLPGFVNQSEGLDEEIQDFTVLGEGRLLVASTGTGDLLVYQRESLDIIDKVRGHPGSVDTLAKVNESQVITGCADGYVRLVSITPPSLLGPICAEEQREYNSDAAFSIERVEISPDGFLLSSVSHEHMIKFWDLQDLGEPAQPVQNAFFQEFQE